MGEVVLVYNPELGKKRQEDQEFKISLNNVSCLRPACAMRDFVSKNKAKIRQNQDSFLDLAFKKFFGDTF